MSQEETFNLLFNELNQLPSHWLVLVLHGEQLETCVKWLDDYNESVSSF